MNKTVTKKGKEMNETENLMMTLDDLRVVTYAFIIFQSLSCEIQHGSGDNPLSEKMTNLKICGKSEV